MSLSDNIAVLNASLRDARNLLSNMVPLISQMKPIQTSDPTYAGLITQVADSFVAAQAAVDGLQGQIDVLQIAANADCKKVVDAIQAFPQNPQLPANTTPAASPAAPVGNTFTPQATAAVGLGGLVAGLLGGWWFWGQGSRKKNPIGEAPHTHRRRKRRMKR